MAFSKYPSMTTAMFTQENIEYNRMTGAEKGQCILKRKELECVDKDGLVYSIKIRNLKGIEMFGTFYSVNRHRYENIIALTIGNSIKFLKFDNKDDMEKWYSELMKPLRREGWTEEADETQPGRRCATSPEGLKKPNRTDRRLYASAYGSLQEGFVSKEDKRKAVYDVSSELLTEYGEGVSSPQSSGSSTDSSDGDDDDLLVNTEDLSGNDVANASAIYENTKDVVPPARPKKQPHSHNRMIRVVGHNNIVITDVIQQTGCELNINTKESFDISVVAELQHVQAELRKITKLTKHLVSQLTRVNLAGNQSSGALQDNPTLYQASQKIEAHGGELHQVYEGSIVFIVRFKSKEDLKRFWLAYSSGELVQSLTSCLVTPDIEQRAGCKVTLQLNIQESEYITGLETFDEAVSESSYVVPEGKVCERHDYVNLPCNDKDTTSAQMRQDSFMITTILNNAESEDDNTSSTVVKNLCKSEYMPLIINKNSPTRTYEEPVIVKPPLMKSKQKPPPVAVKPKNKHKSNITKEVSSGQNNNGVHVMKQSSDFKAELSTFLHKGAHLMVSPTVVSSNNDYYLEPVSEDGIYIEIDKSTHSPTKGDQELYETFEQPQDVMKMVQKTKSLRSLRSTTPTQVQTRKHSVPLSVSNDRDTVVTVKDQPQLPWRNGETLQSSISTFKRLQGEDSITVTLNKTAICDGKRLALAKVKGLTYIWINHWDPKGSPLEEKIHPGDQILSINGKDLKDCDITSVYKQIAKSKEQKIVFQLRRAPHANVVYIQSSVDYYDLGIELDGNVIRKVDPNGLFSKVSKSKTTGVLSSNLVEWAITEINMQPVNRNFSSEQIQELLDKAVPHTALVIQPSDLVLAMKKACQN